MKKSNERTNGHSAQFAIGWAGFNGGTAALNFNVTEDLVRTVAPDDLANEPGHDRDIWG